MSSLHYLPENTQVSFELQGSLPIFRERYVSPQAGTVVLRGIFNHTAQLEPPDGSRYRLRSPKKDREYLTQLVYPIVRLPEKVEVFRLLTPLKLGPGAAPRLRFTTTVDDQPYVFRQLVAGQRGFELWDGMEMQKLVRRDTRHPIVSRVTVLFSVPTVLVLLLPWLDNQTVAATPR